MLPYSYKCILSLLLSTPQQSFKLKLSSFSPPPLLLARPFFLLWACASCQNCGWLMFWRNPIWKYWLESSFSFLLLLNLIIRFFSSPSRWMCDERWKTCHRQQKILGIGELLLSNDLDMLLKQCLNVWACFLTNMFLADWPIQVSTQSISHSLEGGNVSFFYPSFFSSYGDWSTKPSHGFGWI